jgi:hypothetical protein
LSGKKDKISYQTVGEWKAALDEFANNPSLAKAANRFVDDSREGIY